MRRNTASPPLSVMTPPTVPHFARLLPGGAAWWFCRCGDRAVRRVPGIASRGSGRQRLASFRLHRHADRQDHVLCDRRAGDGSDLGLHRHPVPGHGTFPALGGYAMGMYLMRSIGREGVYHATCPTSWCSWIGRRTRGTGASPITSGTRRSGRARAGPARVRVWLLRVSFAHQRRLFSIITQAMTFAFMLLFSQRHRLRWQQQLHGLQTHPRLSNHRARDADRAVV